ncbi:RmlC-like cupin domain-containing protein [Schizophyllum amplum]|uniref:Mannose-6-phosphate isomerase n=1 Tax=Schizophyllum amplum TaxID=97359 RepID=A0A550C226_9AGAR|nr:RmlC-like cupin domain-containing protein [Auriculariopsis ampla]
MSAVDAVFKIIPTIQDYDWGKVGEASKVAQLAAASKVPGFTLNAETPYAELWMGTHPKSSSVLQSDASTTLAKHLAAHPELMGEQVTAKFEGDGTKEGNLPFLFKVLSIQKALSIQTHPDKQKAGILHKEKPDIYKDPNHKPEMALALTPFKAMCGFLPLEKIVHHLLTTPEFTALVPPKLMTSFMVSINNPERAKSYLKDLFATIMTLPESTYGPQLTALVARYKAGDLKAGELRDVVELVLKLDEDFPGDIGIWCAFLLNYLTLEKGEAIFLGAGEPHAYVYGDIMECMANSDNVIRAGLTPKLRDIPNLVDGLTYVPGPGTKHAVQPTAFSSPSRLYDPPIPEFSVVMTALGAGEADTHRVVNGPSIAIVTEGAAAVSWGSGELQVSVGDVFFVGSGLELSVKASDQLVLFRAFVEA